MAPRRAAVIGMEIGGQVAQALGLQSTRHITIDIPLEGAVTVKVEFYPTAEELSILPTLLQTYRLFPRTLQDLEDERARVRDAARVFAEYGVSVQPQMQIILRQLLDRTSGEEG